VALATALTPPDSAKEGDVWSLGRCPILATQFTFKYLNLIIPFSASDYGAEFAAGCLLSQLIPGASTEARWSRGM
jgi:hypothetical protein